MPGPDELQAFILSLGHLAEASPPADPVPISAPSVTAETGWEITNQQMHGMAEFDQVVTFGVDSAVWPGSVLQGAFSLDPVPASVPLARAPLTLTVSGLSASGGASMSRTIDQPSRNSVQDALSEILNQPNLNPGPANFSIGHDQAWSTSQLFATAGINVNFASGSASASMSAAVSQSRATFVAAITQTYYKVSVSDPGPAAPFFLPSVSVDDAQAYMGANNPPVYVSEVIYGRRLLVAMSTQTLKEDYSAELQASYNWGAGSAQGSASASSTSVVSQLGVKLLDVGGSTAAVLSLMQSSPGDPAALNALSKYISDGQLWSLASSPGGIIGWTLKHVGDTRGVTSSTPLDYNKRTFRRLCENVPEFLAFNQDASGRAQDDDWTTQRTFYPSSGMKFDPGTFTCRYVVLRGKGTAKITASTPDFVIVETFTQSVNNNIFGGHHSGSVDVYLSYRQCGA